MKKVNPLKITQGNLPLFVFSDDTRGFMGWAIKSHTKGNYNHVMIMIEPGYFVSQGLSYKKVPVEAYMKSNIRLKFWRFKTHNKEYNREIIEAVLKDLGLPWWKKRYDWLGIVGQFIPGRWTRKLNFMSRKYCSERVADYVRIIYPEFKNIHPTPSEINEFFKTKKEMVIKGYYFND